MTRAEAMEKIKKLLRLKHGGTPDEIATAMRLAQQLADQCGIEIGAVDASLDADRFAVAHGPVIERAEIPAEIHLAANLVKRFVPVDFVIDFVYPEHTVFGVFLRSRRCRLNVIGREADRLIASYLVVFLSRALAKLWRTKRGRCRNKQSFLQGACAAIGRELEKFRPRVEPSEGLLVSWNTYIETHFGPTKARRRNDGNRAGAALWNGYRAGLGVDVMRPMRGEPAGACASRPALPARACSPLKQQELFA